MDRLVKATLAVLGTLALAAPAAAQFGGPPAPPNTGDYYVNVHTGPYPQGAIRGQLTKG